MMCNHEKLNAPTATQRNIHLNLFVAKEEEGKREKCMFLLALIMVIMDRHMFGPQPRKHKTSKRLLNKTADLHLELHKAK